MMMRASVAKLTPSLSLMSNLSFAICNALLNANLFSNLSNYPTRISDGDNIVGDIPCYNRSGTDCDIVANIYSGKNGHAPANPDIVTDGDWLSPLSPTVSLDRIGTMTSRIYADVRADEAIIPDGDRCFIQYGEIEVGEEAPAHVNLLSVIAVEWLVDNDLVISYGPQQILQDSEPGSCIRRGNGIVPVNDIMNCDKFLQKLWIYCRIRQPGKHLFLFCHKCANSDLAN